MNQLVSGTIEDGYPIGMCDRYVDVAVAYVKRSSKGRGAHVDRLADHRPRLTIDRSDFLILLAGDVDGTRSLVVPDAEGMGALAAAGEWDGSHNDISLGVDDRDIIREDVRDIDVAGALIGSQPGRRISNLDSGNHS